MKIQCIRIKNLASLEGITEINFASEPLLSSGIFAITGPTGAGKSTILDALCLALYGKTPRYMQAKESGIDIADVQGSAISQGDVRGILRDGTGDGFAEVDFIGIDGQLYRATWRVRRAREKAEGSLQGATITLKNIDTNSDFPGRKTEVQDEIERLVGVNFEQFTRSVLLAQGDFTAFLKAAKDEKSALLEKLTGTHIYSEISKQVYVHAKQEEQELANLNLQRQGINTLTKEELESLAEQKAAIENITQTQEKETEIINNEISWHSQLTILSAGLTRAELAYDQSKAIKTNAFDREHKLKQVEQIQPARIMVDSQTTSKNQLSGKTVFLQQLQNTLIGMQEQKVDLDIALQNANGDVAAKMKMQEDAKPLLEEARGLDIQVKEKTSQAEQATRDVNEIDQRYNEQQQQLQTLQTQADQLHANIEKLKQWKEENKGRQPIAENQKLIASKLSDAGFILVSLKSILPNLDLIQTRINKTNQEKDDLENQSATILKKLDTERTAINLVADTLSGISVTTLESDKVAIDQSIEQLIGADGHWKVLFNNQKDLDNLKLKLTGNKTEWATKSMLLSQTSEQLIVFTAEKDTALLMLNKARLAVAEDVEALRSQLITGDPCPVCGNAEHPYATQHPQFNRVLNELETAYQQHEKKYTDSLRNENSLRETGNQLKETIAAQEEEISLKEIALQDNKTDWDHSSVSLNIAFIPDEQKAGWLTQQLSDNRIKQKELQEQLKSYSAKKHELETLQNNVNDLEKQLNNNGNSRKDAERNLQSLHEQLNQYNSEITKNNNILSEIEQSLSGNFTTTGWFENWKANAVQFLHAINDFAEKWNAGSQKLQEDTQQYSVVSATLKSMQEQLTGILNEVKKSHTNLDALNAQQQTFVQKRKTIFNGEAAVTVESNLKQAVISAQQFLDKTKAACDKLQLDFTRIDAQKEQAEKDISLLQQQIEISDKNICEWLIAFNTRHNSTLDIDQLMNLLEISAEWLEIERQALRAIDNTITQTHSVLQERTSQLQQHQQQRLSERTAEELNKLLSSAKINLQQKQHEKNEISFRLQQDEINKQKIGDLLTLINTKSIVVENWAKLNEIIGSADGKKFRQIAQGYTLDVLLGYANVHLDMLNKRYLLQRIPYSLGLQVLDQDMGDEIRTVFSLSGGESFLVSLALALGLASLSSSRMQVESLFIDEGFGSLDPTTLNIAMDALERLHNQGRKVGVISHVQEMTERIPVQIKVSKHQSGRSKVEVIGF